MGTDTAYECCMQDRVGDAYQLYFLEDQESKPVAVVLPKDATQPPPTALPEVRLNSCCVTASRTAPRILSMPVYSVCKMTSMTHHCNIPGHKDIEVTNAYP